jgi:hypothetical protein
MLAGYVVVSQALAASIVSDRTHSRLLFLGDLHWVCMSLARLDECLETPT